MVRLSDPTTENLIQCPVHGWVKPNSNHITPRSRGGKNKDNVNKATCPLCHEYYHWLFSNLIPSEIIAYLIKNFWGGQVRWVIVFLWQHLMHKAKRIDSWPEDKADWTGHPEEGYVRQGIAGEKKLLGEMRKVGLGRGDLCVVNERTKEIVRWAKARDGQSQEQLLAKILAGGLNENESIRPVVWKPLLSE